MRTKKDWGQALRDFRHQGNFSQATLAKAVKISQSKLSKAEAGKALLTLIELESLVSFAKLRSLSQAKNLMIA